MKRKGLLSLVLGVVLTLGNVSVTFADDKAPKVTEEVTVNSTEITGGWGKERLWGQDRFKTAIAVADEFCKTNKELGVITTNYPDTANQKVDTVIIANGFNFPDAMCATPLTRWYNAPILLTHANRLTDTTADWIKKNDIKTAIVIGGETVVTPQVEKELENSGVTGIKRLGGQTRFDTSFQVACEVEEMSRLAGQPIEGAFFLDGMEWQDTLVSSPFAGQMNQPLCLVPRDPDIAKQSSWKKMFADNSVKLEDCLVFAEANLGQDEELETPWYSLMEMIDSNLKPGEHLTWESIYGSQLASLNNNYCNAFDINDYFINTRELISKPQTFAMANGKDFADALTIAPLMAKMQGALMLEGPCDANSIQEELQHEADNSRNLWTASEVELARDKTFHEACEFVTKVYFSGGNSKLSDTADDVLIDKPYRKGEIK